MYLVDIFTVPVNLAGIPSLAIPIGKTSNNLPIGMQLIGNYFNESKLINTGYKYEQNIGGFEMPALS